MGSNPTAAKKVLPKIERGHTDLNHGPIGLQPIALPLSYIPRTCSVCVQECPVQTLHPGGQITPFANTPLIFHESSPGSVGGIMVSIAAFQAVDPGSIPGRRNFFQS